MVSTVAKRKKYEEALIKAAEKVEGVHNIEIIDVPFHINKAYGYEGNSRLLRMLVTRKGRTRTGAIAFNPDKEPDVSEISGRIAEGFERDYNEDR